MKTDSRKDGSKVTGPFARKLVPRSHKVVWNMKEETMPSKWIGCIHRGHVGKRWSPREHTYRYDPEDKSYNAGRQEYEM